MRLSPQKDRLEICACAKPNCSHAKETRQKNRKRVSEHIGAGPWFYGHVNNHFHPDHGYRGPAPHVGDRVEAGREHPPANFHGNEVRDGHGHLGGGND